MLWHILVAVLLPAVLAFSPVIEELQTQNVSFGFTPEVSDRTPFLLSPGSSAGGGDLTVPDSVDWVAAGAVTPVKNQGSCASSNIFATTGAMEGAHFIATGNLESFSEQQLVSCSKQSGACAGGGFEASYGYVFANGIFDESAYPYTAQQGACDTNAPKVDNRWLQGYSRVTGNEQALKTAVAQQPVSVAIQANKLVFQQYTGGIITSEHCGTQPNHAMLVVGYGALSAAAVVWTPEPSPARALSSCVHPAGTDSTGHEFWKVKNSWGPSWGEEGFVRIARGENACGITLHAYAPNIAAKDTLTLM